MRAWESDRSCCDVSVGSAASQGIWCLQMPPARHPEPGVQVGEGNLSLGSSDARRSRSIGDVPSPCSMSIGSRKYKNRQICRRGYFNGDCPSCDLQNSFVSRFSGFDSFHRRRVSFSNAWSRRSTSCSASSCWRCCSASSASLASVGAAGSCCWV